MLYAVSNSKRPAASISADDPPLAHQEVAVFHAVSGQVLWSHWHAISTSSDPASSQAWPQYLLPGCTKHRHGRCEHLFSVVVITFFLSQLPASGGTLFLPLQTLGCLLMDDPLLH